MQSVLLLKPALNSESGKVDLKDLVIVDWWGL